MSDAFFPNMPFAWIFCILLWSFVILAAIRDTRSARIPNQLVLITAITGLIATLVRSGWNSAQNQKLWIFDTGSIPLGMIDGLIFAIVGFLLAFFGLFIFWILGLCGGGDVKLFGAVGLWLGWKYVTYVWMASFVMLWIWMIAAVLMRGLSPSAIRGSMKSDRKPDASGQKSRKKFRVTYSLPIAFAVVGVCMVKFNIELGFKPIEQPKIGQLEKGGDRDALARNR